MEIQFENIFSRVAFAALVFCLTLTACGGESTSQGQNTSGAGPLGTRDASGDAAPLVITPNAPDVTPCTSPYAPVLEAVPTHAVLPVFANQADGLEVSSATGDPDAGSNWLAATSVQLPSTPADLRIQARIANPLCSAAVDFSRVYAVRDRFAPAAGSPDSTAISHVDTHLQQWATRVIEYAPGSDVGSEWSNPQRSLGPAGDDTLDVTSLGEGGTITLGFDAVLRDGDGYDLAVFENGFGDDYLELAFVEVSSDGVHFVRFDTASIVNEPVAAYGTMDPTLLEGFAGKYRIGWGTPLDLAWLRDKPEVRSGLVDLMNVTAVRIVDIVGDGRVRDSFGHIVYDPYPTSGSAGFDLDAVGLLNIGQ